MVLSLVIVLAWLGSLEANRRGREGWAFLASATTLALVVVTLFSALYPYVMPSSLNIADSLDIFNASSTDYTLKVMTYVAVVMTPLVLIYQGWTYWVFRKRLSASSIPTPESGVLDKINS
jgi:cytochrome d ubiquinol oxidase subunit II